MKISHFTGRHFSKISQTFIYDYVDELERRSMRGHVITRNRVNAQLRPFPRVSVVKKPPLWNPRLLWYRLLETLGMRNRHTSSWPQLQERWEKEVRKFKPEIIHAHFGTVGVRVGPVADRLGVPLVTTFHGGDAFKMPGRDPWKKKYHDLFEQATRITVVARVVGEQLVSLGAPPEKIKVVHVGKRMNEYSYRSPRAPVRNWISVGRLVEKKGFEDCLKAFKKLVDRIPDSSLTIIGEGRRMSSLKSLAKEIGLENSVHFLGQKPHKEVKRQLIEADAFVLCSKRAQDGQKEGIPTVLMEAQAIGLPVVSTKHSGIPEVIPKSHHNLLAPEGDVKTIARYLYRIATRSTDELTSIAEQGRRKMEREFNLVSEVGKLCDVYKKCLE